jgi:hypothetical protein
MNLIPSVLIPILIATGAYLGLSCLDHERILSDCLTCTKLDITLISRSIKIMLP